MITTNGQDLLNFLDKKMLEGVFSNDDLVQFIEVTGQYLGLMTIPNYQKVNKKSYNGVKNHRHIQTIFNVRFVIDNE